jgi:protein O-GlcNAc transferase
MDRYRRAGELALVGDAQGAIAILRDTGGGLPDAADHSYALLLSHYAMTSPEVLFDEHLRWAEQHAKRFDIVAVFNHREPDKKLRIGYVSADFRDGHPLTYFIAPVLRAHDRNQFSIVCYSSVATPDSGTERIAGMADEWRDIRGVSDEAVAAMIRADHIDVLVDLGGHCGGSRLLVFAHKPAPIQITWLGYPDTTGLAAMDYRLTDEIADPPGESERFHTEQLVRPAGGFLCYEPPVSDLAVSALPAWFSDGVTFGSFQYPAKITADVIATWARIMQRVPGSSLLLHHCFSDYFDPRGAVRNRIESAFAVHGIAPGRLRFAGGLPLREHLELHAQVDIALDTFPYNGTTTTCESLWMGVPVVTLEGRTHAGRVGKTILTRAGLSDLVAADLNRYVELAAGLASDLDRLAGLRTSLRQTMAQSLLLDANTVTRGVEREYRAMWTALAGPYTTRG